ncbi:MAG TPA: hypothetical protein VF254_00505 [Gammaproteobacteria bacterium]
MKEFPRRGVFVAALLLPLLGGCAGDICNQLAFEETPRLSEPLVIPEGVPAIAEGGQFRVPDAAAAAPVEGCQARPPMTLPPEVLEAPEEELEEDDEAGAEEA